MLNTIIIALPAIANEIVQLVQDTRKLASLPPRIVIIIESAFCVFASPLIGKVPVVTGNYVAVSVVINRSATLSF